MKLTRTTDDACTILAVSGRAADEPAETWAVLRREAAEAEGNLVCDLSDLTGASDRLVETMLALTADAHNRGDACVFVSVNAELAARLGAMQVDRYILSAEALAQARAMLAGPGGR